MIGVVIFLVIGTGSLLSGIAGMTQNIEGFFFEILFGIAMIAVAVAMLKKRKKGEAQPAVQKPDIQPVNQPAEQPVKEIKEKDYSCKIAGVTFNNRQNTLRRLYLNGDKNAEDVVVIEGDISINHYLYEGEDAFSVLCGGEEVGNIPRENIEDIKLINDRIFKKYVLVNWFDDSEERKRVYFARLMVYYI